MFSSSSASSSGRTSPGPRKMGRAPDQDASDIDASPRPKSPFSMAFRSKPAAASSSSPGSSSRLTSSSSSQSDASQVPVRRGIFRKKSISSLSMMSVNDDDASAAGDGGAQNSPKTPSSTTASRIPTAARTASPAPGSPLSSAARKADHRRSVSYSGIIDSANKAQSEMKYGERTPPSSHSRHGRSPSSVSSSRIPVSATADAGYARRQQPVSDSPHRRLYGRDDVRDYIQSGRPRCDTNGSASHDVSSEGARPRTPAPAPTTPQSAHRVPASPSSIPRYSNREKSPATPRDDNTQEVIMSPAEASPRATSSPHDIRSASVLGIRAEDEPASRTASPISRIPRSSGMRSQLSRSGSTVSRRSFLEWVSGGSGSSNKPDADDASSIRSSSTQHTINTMTPSSSGGAGASATAGVGLKFPSSPLIFLRSSSALGHSHPDRSTTPTPTPTAPAIPKYPQPSRDQAPTPSQRRETPSRHERAPSQISMYSQRGTPSKSSQQSQQQTSSIPFYRRFRTTSTSAKSLFNNAEPGGDDHRTAALQVPREQPQQRQRQQQQQHPPRAPSAMSGFFSSLQKTKSKDELQAQHQQQRSHNANKVNALGGLRRDRADTSPPTAKRTLKDSISQPVAQPGAVQDHAQNLRAASAMSFRDDDVMMMMPSPQPPYMRGAGAVDSRRGSAATATSGSITPATATALSTAASVREDAAHRGRGLRKGTSASSSNSSRHSLFLPSSTSNGGVGNNNAGALGVASNLKSAGKRGWGMVKGWRGAAGVAGGTQGDEDEAAAASNSNKARKNNSHGDAYADYSRPASVMEGGQDVVLRKWSLLPDVVPPALLSSSADAHDSLIFGVALRDAVRRTRLISPDIDEYLNAREAKMQRRGGSAAAVQSQQQQQQQQQPPPLEPGRRWHQSKRSLASKSDSSDAELEAPSHLRKTIPQLHARRRPSRIGLLDLGSEFSLSGEFFGGGGDDAGENGDVSFDSVMTSVSTGSVAGSVGTKTHQASSDASQRTRVPINRLQARKQYLPRFVTRCIESLETFGLTEEGVYRLSGRSSHTIRLRALFDGRIDADGIDSDEFVWDLDLKRLDPVECDINSVCSALKAYLRELPTPVLDRDHLKVLLSQAQKFERTKTQHAAAEFDHDVVLNALCDMDPAPWYLLRELAYHLGDITQASVVAKTKMTLSNLSLVLAPTLSIPLNTLAFVVLHRDLLFQRGPREDVQLDKVREGDVIGGVVGRERGERSERSERRGEHSALYALKTAAVPTSSSSSSGTSTPSSTASPSAFANSTFSFRSPRLDAGGEFSNAGSNASSDSASQLRPRRFLNLDSNGTPMRNHNRDSSASDATILAGPLMSSSSLQHSPDAYGDAWSNAEPTEVLRNGIGGGDEDVSGGSKGWSDDETRQASLLRKPGVAYSHSASNSGSTWGSSNADSITTSSSGYRSRFSSANSLLMTSDDEPATTQQQSAYSSQQFGQVERAPPTVAKDWHYTKRVAAAADGDDADSTLSAPGSPARMMSASARGMASPSHRAMTPSVSQGSSINGNGTAFARSPHASPSPSSPSSPSLVHSPSYSSFASDAAGGGDHPAARSGRTSALDRPRPVASGSGSFFATSGSSSGHGHVRRGSTTSSLASPVKMRTRREESVTRS